MTGKSPTRRRRRTLDFLTPQLIVDTAMEIIESEGADALTFRRIGTALDVDHTVILRQFPSKDLLLLAMTDRLLTDAIESFTPSDNWRDTLRDLAQQVRMACRAHPGVAAAVAGRTARSEAEFAGANAVIGCLLAAGLSGREAASYYRALVDLALAYASLEASLLAVPDDDLAGDHEAWSREYQEVSAEEYPFLAAVAEHLPDVDAEDQFTVAMELLLDAVELRAARAAQGGT